MNSTGPRLLVYSRTTGYRHDSIPAGVQALRLLGEQAGWTVDATEDPAAFTPGGLAGARFSGHPAEQTATVTVEDRGHPATSHLPAAWRWHDEWYDFRANPRPQVHVLLTVDEASYDGGTMGADHPVAWCHEHGGGRCFYTALGHGARTFSEPSFLRHLGGALRWLTD